MAKFAKLTVEQVELAKAESHVGRGPELPKELVEFCASLEEGEGGGIPTAEGTKNPRGSAKRLVRRAAKAAGIEVGFVPGARDSKQVVFFRMSEEEAEAYAAMRAEANAKREATLAAKEEESK